MALRELTTPNPTPQAWSFPGRHGEDFPSYTSLALASTAAVTVVDTVAWYKEENLAINVLHVSTFAAGRVVSEYCAPLTLTPPAW